MQQNADVLGAAWFIKGIKFANNSQDEMAALDNLNTKDSAVADKSFSTVLKNNFIADSSATITFIKNENDSVRYTSKASSEQLAVFSEVYYDKGWNAYIDGKQVPYAKVNYVLRGMMIPAGDHSIEFKFEPTLFFLSKNISAIASWLLFVLLLAALFMEWRKGKPTTEKDI